MKALHMKLFIVLLILIMLIIVLKYHKLIITQSDSTYCSERKSTATTQYMNKRDLMNGMLYEPDGVSTYNGGKEIPVYRYFYADSKGLGRPSLSKQVNLLDQVAKADTAYELIYSPPTIPKAPLETKLKLHMFTVQILVNYVNKQESDEKQLDQILAESERSIKHYCQSERVHKIVLIWNVKQMRKRLRDKALAKLKKLQQILTLPTQKGSMPLRPVPLFIVRDSGTTIATSLRPHLFIETDSIFIVRLGTLVDIKDLNYGFLMWKWFPDLLVSFTTNTKVRKVGDPVNELCPVRITHHLQEPFSFGSSAGKYYGTVCRLRETGNLFGLHQNQVSITAVPTTLTGSFTHRKYLDLYSYETPKRLHNFVGNEPLLLDLAFSQVVTQSTQHAPILVKPEQSIFIPQRYLQEEAEKDYLGLIRQIVQVINGYSQLEPSTVDSFIQKVDFKVERLTLRDVT